MALCCKLLPKYCDDERTSKQSSSNTVIPSRISNKLHPNESKAAIFLFSLSSTYSSFLGVFDIKKKNIPHLRHSLTR